MALRAADKSETTPAAGAGRAEHAAQSALAATDAAVTERSARSLPAAAGPERAEHAARSAPAAATDVTAAEAAREAAAAAVAFKDRLVEYDRDSARRTHVIDDQSDFFEIDTNAWLDADVSSFYP